MKNPYRILPLFLVLFLSTQTTLADTNGSQIETSASITTLASGGGFNPSPKPKENGIIAFGSGSGFTPKPKTAETTNTLFCDIGLCFKL